MPLFHIVLVAIIQGLTEFLPVSSSAHLILLPKLTGLQDQGQAIDIAVHVGTLGAVLLYFRRDFAVAAGGLPVLLRGKTDTPGSRVALYLILSTLPLIAFGVLLKATGKIAPYWRWVVLAEWLKQNLPGSHIALKACLTTDA